MKSFYIFYGKLGSGVSTALIRKLKTLIDEDNYNLSIINSNTYSIGNTEKLEFISRLTHIPLLNIDHHDNKEVPEADTFLVDLGNGIKGSEALKTFLDRVSKIDEIDIFFCPIIDIRDWLLTGFAGLDPERIIGRTPETDHEIRIFTFVERAMNREKPTFKEAIEWIQNKGINNWNWLCLGPDLDADWCLSNKLN
jgi:hypothetical protein